MFGEKRDQLLATKRKGVSYLEGFKEWVVGSNQSGTRCSLSLAPSGMTTHEKYITPMYWEYFAVPDVIKVMVNVNMTNPFGVNLRTVTASSGVSEILTLMMPYMKASVTYHVDAVDQHPPITSQEECNQLVKSVYEEKHGKVFAGEWTQKLRRKMDKYIKKGEYVKFPEFPTDRLATPNLVNISHAPDESIMARIPVETRVLTSSLIGNEGLGKFKDLMPNEIALLNPKTMADEMLASVYDIPMIHARCSKLDAIEADLAKWVQKNLDFVVFNYIGKLMHFVLLEKNLILVAVLLVGSGRWSTQIFLLGKMTALAHYWILLVKIIVRRARPVWLPLHMGIKSGVSDIQADGSFPSGHTGFLALIATVAYREPDLFADHTVIILLVIAVCAIERVKTGAHFLSDVVSGGLYSYAFVSIFYYFKLNESLLYRVFPSDLSAQVRFTVYMVIVQLFCMCVVEVMQASVSPLLRETIFQNNLMRLPKPRDPQECAKPLSESRDFLAPYLALTATMFWTPPIMIRERLAPLPGDTTTGTRLFGSVSVLAFIIVFVLPLRKLVGHQFRYSHYLRFLLLVLIYMSMLLFTALFGHALIQAVSVVQ